MNKQLKHTIIWITIFSISMGLLESAVVVYLRELLYPNGFDFPLVAMNSKVALTELLRELATIIMLISIGILTGRTKNERFAWFIYSFAIWDIFYYVFLKVLIQWPESIMTWDILFLLPTMWVGPVICPVILSIGMIILALFIVQYSQKNADLHLKPLEWTLLISGSLICIVSFTLEYSQYMLDQFSIREMFIIGNMETLTQHSMQYIPQSFPWWIFITGIVVIALGILRFVMRYYGRNSEK